MRNILKKSILILFLIMLISSITVNFLSVSHASSYVDLMGDEINKERTDNTETSGSVSNIITTIVVAVKLIAVAVAIIMLLAVAMKYMVSAPGEKAEIKKSAVVYIVGAIILFAVSGILTLIQQFSGAISVSAE